MGAAVAPVTVGIPYYAGDDHEHFRCAVESVVHQTVTPRCIHLIQDGPVSRNMRRVVESFTARENVEQILIEDNRGLSHAINVSILQAETEYYARMDADDICHEDRIRQQISYMENYPSTDILGTAALEFEKSPCEDSRTLKVMPECEDEIKRMAHYRTPFIHPSVVFRRQVFARIGLYEGRDMVDDVELWMRAVGKDVGMANLPQPLLYYRTAGVVNRRASFSRAVREAGIRLKRPTTSPKLNLLKLSSIGFRLMPACVQEWGYRHLRSYLS